jgi:hypothetical protein
MKMSSTAESQRTLRIGKYVLALDGLVTTLRPEKLPGTWCSIPELLDRFPGEAAHQSVGHARGYPAFDFHYSGSDSRYDGGQMPATIIPADSVLRINEGRAYGRHCAIYAPDGTGLMEFDYQQRSLKTFREVLPAGRLNPRYWLHALSRSWQNTRLPAARYWPGKVAALNAPSSHNYFHWMLEILPRVVTLQKAGIVPDWYLIDAYKPFQLATLAALNIPLERIIQPYSGLHVRAQELLVPLCHYPGPCPDIQRELIQRIGTASLPTSSGRIFINRRQSRKPANLTGFQKILHRHGFQEHFLEDYSLPQQIALFRQAEAVVAMHGAGLTNLVFCKPGTIVVELMPEGKFQPCYPQLSRVQGLRHHLVTAQRTGFHQDMLVPIETVCELLAEIFLQPAQAVPAATRGRWQRAA